MELQDSVVIITGASSGIGAAAARTFAQAGAKLSLAARSEEPLTALAHELGPQRALAVPTDVADRAQAQALIRQTLEQFGRVDILVNNAGVGLSGAVATMNTENFARVLAINVLGPIYAIQAVVPHMRKPSGGLIINISSMVSKLTIPTIGGYRASKCALDAISNNARFELARDNIRVITVYPGRTMTNFGANALDRDRSSGPPLGRGPKPKSAEFVAQRIVEGARKEPREVFMDRGSGVVAFVGSILPGLFERVMRMMLDS